MAHDQPRRNGRGEHESDEHEQHGERGSERQADPHRQHRDHGPGVGDQEQQGDGLTRVSTLGDSERRADRAAMLAELFGLRDRGVLREGAHADIFVFDPETVGAEHATLVHDLPGDSPRLTAGAIGVRRVYVNGQVAVEDDQATDALSGTVIRSGRDTATVATR